MYSLSETIKCVEVYSGDNNTLKELIEQYREKFLDINFLKIEAEAIL